MRQGGDGCDRSHDSAPPKLRRFKWPDRTSVEYPVDFAEELPSKGDTSEDFENCRDLPSSTLSFRCFSASSAKASASCLSMLLMAYDGVIGIAGDLGEVGVPFSLGTLLYLRSK